MRRGVSGAVMAAAVIGLVGAVVAQQPAVRTIVQQKDLSVPGREVVTASVEFGPGGAVAPHTHAGEEVGYVTEGVVTVEIAGQPPQTVKAGEAFFIPNGLVHGAKNAGATTARAVANYIVEKGKPLATPTPAK